MKLGQALICTITKQANPAALGEPGALSRAGTAVHDFLLGPKEQADRSNINWKTIGRFGLGGLGIGAGAAGMLNLLRMFREKREEKAMAEEPSDTEQNTIVLTLPRKTAQLVSPVASAAPVKPIKSVGPKVRTYVGPKTSSQTRHHDGTVGPSTIKYSQEGWKTETGSYLAGLAGLGGGAVLVNKLYQMRREKELKNKLEAAKQDYLAQLQGKVAEIDLLQQELCKEAQESTFATGAHLPAYAALMYILAAGGGGYLVKRYLDQQFQKAKQEGLDIPKVKRIVFKTAPASQATPPIEEEKPKEEPLTPYEQQAIKTSMVAMKLALSGHPEALQDVKVKEATVLLGLDLDEMQKTAQTVQPDEDVEGLMDPLMRSTNDPAWRERAGIFGLRSKGAPRWMASVAHKVPGVHGYVQGQTDEQVRAIQDEARKKLYGMIGQPVPQAGQPAAQPQEASFGRSVQQTLAHPINTYKGLMGMNPEVPAEARGWSPALHQQYEQKHPSRWTPEVHRQYQQQMHGGGGGWWGTLMNWWKMLQDWYKKIAPQAWGGPQSAAPGGTTAPAAAPVAKVSSAQKQALTLPMDMLSNLVTGKMIEEGSKNDLPAAIAQAQFKMMEEKKRKANAGSTARSIQLAAVDPAAASYLAQNKAKILKIMTEMEAAGKL